MMMGTVDCKLTFFDKPVSEWAMLAVLGGSVILLIAVYVLLNIFAKRKKA
jgi:hypothetical protein